MQRKSDQRWVSWAILKPLFSYCTSLHEYTDYWNKMLGKGTWSMAKALFYNYLLIFSSALPGAEISWIWVELFCKACYSHLSQVWGIKENCKCKQLCFIIFIECLMPHNLINFPVILNDANNGEGDLLVLQSHRLTEYNENDLWACSVLCFDGAASKVLTFEDP